MNLLSNLFGAALGGKADGAAGTGLEGILQSLPSSTVAGMVSNLFHSDQTPPFGKLIGDSFGAASSSADKAGLLNQLTGALGPAALSGIGAILGNVLAPGQTQFTPEQAAKVTPQEATALANYAAEKQPDIMDTVGEFYAQHKSMINTFGAAAITFFLAKLSENSRKA